MHPPTKFDWTIYADATLAGLSVLIPIPLVDWLFERFFRRRMVTTIAKRRKFDLHPEAKAIVNDTSDLWDSVLGCLVLPFWLAIQLAVKLSRKLLYFLTVKSAVDALNYYWQRAYLLDYMVREGHLSGDTRLVLSAEKALTRVLKQNVRSPLNDLARDVVRSPGRLWRSLRRARRGQEDAELRQRSEEMERRWYQYDAHFLNLQREFDLALFEYQPVLVSTDEVGGDSAEIA